MAKTKKHKLHELLAVGNSVDNQAAKCLGELISTTFEKKRHHFEQKDVTFNPLDEGAKPVVEAQSSIQTTVKKELEWISTFLVKRIDVEGAINEANTLARADVILEDGVVIAANVPATTLLELEKRVAELQKVVANIPTLDPSKGFNLDEQTGYYKARDVVKNRTKKTSKVLVKYPATVEHPAQTEMVSEDVVVGTVHESEWSGLITPHQKADALARVEDLLRAVKSARSRANEQEVDSVNIGQGLVDYVFRGLV